MDLPVHQGIAMLDRIYDPNGSILHTSDFLDASSEMASGRSDCREGTSSEVLASHYRKILERVHALVFELDPDGKVLFTSSGFEASLGYRPSELLGEDWWQIFFPGKKSWQADEICRRIKEGDISGYGAVLQSRDGTDIAVVLSTACIRYQGRLQRIVGFGDDIADLGRSRRAQNGREELFRGLIENSRDGISLIDEQGLIIEWNPALERITGIKMPDVVGRTIWDVHFRDIMPEEMRTPEICWRMEFATRRMIATGQMPGPGSFHEWNIQSPAGELTYIQSHLFPIRTDKGFMIGNIHRDITSLKKAEESLKAERTRLFSLLNEIPGSVLLIAPDYSIRYSNRNSREHFGNNLGKLCYESIKGLSSPCPGCPLSDVLAKGTSQVMELPPASDGRVYQVHFSLFSDFDGSPLVMKLGIDITERKRSEEAIQKAKDDLERLVQKRTAWILKANEALHDEMIKHKKLEKELKCAKEATEAAARAKSEFLANMSHEIRTPLNAIIGTTEIMDGSCMASEEKDCLDTIRKSSEALLAIINDVLDFSKIEGGKMEFESRPFSIRECIELSLNMISSKACKKGLALRYVVAAGVPDFVLGDMNRLLQVLVNLLSNAVKFTDRGKVAVYISSISAENGLWEIHFQVLDTGTGIAQESIGRLFQSFSQVDASISRRYGGTGLGLAISKRLVSLMGGEIWADSLPGVGSRFHFTISAAPTSDRQSKMPAPAFKAEGRAQQAPLAILLAEDNPVNQKVALKMLKKIGLAADVAECGVDVISALERKEYDMVLMDVQMPRMDGLEAARQIRERWPERKIKIIALTAYAMGGDRDRCLEAGMDGYISKPIRMEELRSAIFYCS